MRQAKYFVWIKGVGGKPCPQIWYEDMRNGKDSFQNKEVGNPDGLLLAFHEVNPKFVFQDIDVLANIYPYKGENNA